MASLPDLPESELPQAAGKLSAFWHWLGRQPMLYPDWYVWLVFLSGLDILLTTAALRLGGYEMNPLADLVIHYGGVRAMVAYKFVLIAFFIIICDIVGKHRQRTGRRLAQFAVGISSVPVVVTLVQLALVL